MYAASSKGTAETTSNPSSYKRDHTSRASESEGNSVVNTQTPAATQKEATTTKKRKTEIPSRSEFAKEWEAQVQWNKVQQEQFRNPVQMATLNESPVKATEMYPTHPYNMSVPQQGFAGFMQQLNLYGQQRQLYVNQNYPSPGVLPAGIASAVQANDATQVSSGLQGASLQKMQQDRVSLSSLPLLYKQELEAYRALVMSTREREQHIQWLETRLKEHGLVDANQPSALSTPISMIPGQLPVRGPSGIVQTSNFPVSNQAVTNGGSKASDVDTRKGNTDTQNAQQTSALPGGNGQSFSTRDYLRGDDTPDLIHDKKVGRVNFVQPGSVPAFIQEELKNAPGNGQFTICELMITLCFAHQLLFHRNTYSTIKKRMLNKRSRASIRRKIEKIVFKETGIDGGLLLAPEEKRIQILSCLWSRFAKLIDEAIVYGSPALESFSKKLRNYANVANATEENLRSGTAWVIKEPKAK